MRQVLALCTALAFMLSLAGAALAQGTTSSGSSATPGSSSATSPSNSTTDTTKSTAPSGSATGATGKSTTGAAGKSDTKSDADKGTAGKDKAGAGKMAGGVRGQHKMMGEVTKIDAAKGMVSLKTDEGDIDLHFPPSALQGIKEGDRVEVQLGLRPAGAGTGTTGTVPGSQPAGKSPAAPSAQPVPPGKQPGVNQPSGSGAPGSPKSP